MAIVTGVPDKHFQVNPDESRRTAHCNVSSQVAMADSPLSVETVSHAESTSSSEQAMGNPWLLYTPSTRANRP